MIENEWNCADCREDEWDCHACREAWLTEMLEPCDSESEMEAYVFSLENTGPISLEGLDISGDIPF